MKLTYRGLKAHNRTLDFQKLNLVLAGHGEGKSSARYALQFLLLGHVPELGKAKQATGAFIQNGEATVALTLDDGRHLSRTIRRKGSSLTGSAEASWIRQGTPGDHEDAIATLAGKEESEAVSNLDIRQLLSLTPSARAQAIEAILASTRKTPAELAVEVAHLTVQRITGLDDGRMPKDYKLALPSLKDSERASLKAAAPMLEAKLKDSGIPGAIQWAKESKNEANRIFDGKNKAKEELEARLGDSSEAPEGEIERLEQERDQLQREIGAAREREEAAKNRAQSLQIAKQELDFAATRLESAKEGQLKAEIVGDGLDDLKAKHAALAKEVIKMQPPQRTPCDEADRLQGDALAKRTTMAELREEPRPDYKDEGRRVDEIQDALDAMEESPWPEIKKIGQTLKRFSDDRVAAHGQRLVDIVTTRLGDADLDPDTLRADLEQAKKDKAAAMARLEAVVTRNANITVQRDRLKAEADALWEEAAKARRAHDASFNEKSAAWTDSIRAKATERDNLHSAIQKAELALERANACLASAKSSYEAAEKRVKELEADATQPEPAKFTRPAITMPELLDQIKSRLDALHRSSAARREFASIIAEIDRVWSDRVVYAALEWALARVREKELGDASAPLLDRVSKFLKAAGRQETPYLRPTRSDCEIGWTRKDGGDVAIQVMSGAEWCIFATAFSAAVIALRKPPLKILIVEGGEVRADQLESLLSGIASVQGELDLALVLYPHETKTTPGNWNVVRLQ